MPKAKALTDPTTSSPTSVAAAIAARNARTGPIGKTIQVRATARGFYGRPLADIRNPGDVFTFAVKDLQPFKDGAVHSDGRDVECITVAGIDYALPSWCEDASKPVTVPADDSADEIDSYNSDEDVI